MNPWRDVPTLAGRYVTPRPLHRDDPAALFGAKCLMFAHAIDAVGCGCVQLRTSSLDRRSRTAIERLGARLDGVLRGHMPPPEGDVRDTVIHSVLTHERLQLRRNPDALLARQA